MATLGLVEYKDASPEVRAVYDDIMAVRKTDWINNFWKAIAHDPATLKRTWEDIKQIMAPGALDPLTKEMIYVAVSVSNQCDYCIASHTVSAKKKGMTDEMFKELMAVVGMANETNRLQRDIRWKSTSSSRAVASLLVVCCLCRECGRVVRFFVCLFGFQFHELEFVLLHIYAAASEGYSFGFQAQALFDGRISA